MRIIILSRGPQLYSTQALAFAARKRKHHVRVIDHLNCNLLINDGKPEIYNGGEKLARVDAVIPRVGASVTFHGTAIIRQFENMGVYCTCTSEAMLRSRDKLRCSQLLVAAGIGTPKTVYTNMVGAYDFEALLNKVGGLPVIIKLLKGTHGLGVMKADAKNDAEAIIEAFNRLKAPVVLQEFIAESGGADIRAFVVNGKIVAAMKRRARPGEFRSNLHRGATAIHIKLTSAEEETAIKAAEVMGLDVAGVDMLQSHRGPLVLEVNPSPGLEGISKTTNIDVADNIIKFVESKIEARQSLAE